MVGEGIHSPMHGYGQHNIFVIHRGDNWAAYAAAKMHRENSQREPILDAIEIPPDGQQSDRPSGKKGKKAGSRVISGEPTPSSSYLDAAKPPARSTSLPSCDSAVTDGASCTSASLDREPCWNPYGALNLYVTPPVTPEIAAWQAWSHQHYMWYVQNMLAWQEQARQAAIASTNASVASAKKRGKRRGCNENKSKSMGLGPGDVADARYCPTDVPKDEPTECTRYGWALDF